MSTSIRRASSHALQGFFALAALCAVFAISAADAHAAPWGAPEEVSVPGGSASWSQVGMDANGDATAVWTRSDGLQFVAQAAERPVGGIWGVPVDLSGAGGNAESVTLAVDPAGDAVAAWKLRLSGSEAIETAYKPAGGVWELRKPSNSAPRWSRPQPSRSTKPATPPSSGGRGSAATT